MAVVATRIISNLHAKWGCLLFFYPPLSFYFLLVSFLVINRCQPIAFFLRFKLNAFTAQ